MIKNTGGNQDIKAKESVKFGFTASYEEEIIIPNTYEFMMWELYVAEENYNAELEIVSDWGSGYNGNIIITNTSDNIIEDWTIEFDYTSNIEKFFTAEILSHDDNHYRVKNAGHNANIEPGQAISLGFDGNPGKVTEDIKNIKIKHVSTSLEELNKDSDEDGLTDLMEEALGTDPYNKDTDGDEIDDYTEIMLGLDPLKQDTDDNGILDGDEDLDEDGLTILQELEYGTDNLSEDTDGDELTDYDEIFVYKTDPLVADTDGDGINDGAELKLGLDPLNEDSDQDGVLDGDEKIEQTLAETIECEEAPQITEVSVSMNGTGLIDETTKIKNTFGIDMMTSDVVGLVGIPVDISTSSSFDEATIKFTYDDDLLGETSEENLRIMWYDEENNQYVIMDEETVLDTKDNTLSLTTDHFSTYLVVDRQEWYDAWSNAISYRRDPETPSMPVEYFDICYIVDRSGSMSGNRITMAKDAISQFINAMYSHDRASIVGYDSSAKVYSNFTDNKQSLKSSLSSIYASGGTSVEAGLVAALDLFDSTEDNYVGGIANSKMILLLCDGDVSYNESTIERAKDQGIKVYPVLVGSTSGRTKLQHIADYTGGTFYYAATAEKIREAIWGIKEETIGDMDTIDRDGDGLYDIYETAGMMLPNGEVMYSNPLKEDTDEDGLTDAEEMGVISEYGEQPKLIQFILDIRGFDSTIYAEYFDYRSNPNEEDTDGDGLLDGKPKIVDSVKIAPKDPEPRITNGPKGIWKEQIKQAEEGNIPTEYGDWYDIDYFKGWGLGGIWPSALTGLGSYILMFREDNMGIALHSDASNFQQVFGYNKFYDFAFYLGTFGNINKEIFRFKSSGEEYVIWIWLGDYLNLGSGAEIGMYTNPHVLENVKIKQWDVVDFLLPMSLSLFYYYDEDNIENIFCWAPRDEQWWITGFNPEYCNPKAEDMVMIGSIDFSGREEMFEDMREDINNDDKLKDYMIFDDDHTAWIVWGM